MKKQLLLLLLMFVSSFIFAQLNYQDVVYLKNGSVVRGIIVEEVPSESIKIKTMDKNTFLFRYEEIQKMTREVFPVSSSSIYFDFGFQYGVGDDVENNSLEFNFIQSFRLNSFLSAGMGTGVRVNLYNNDASRIPVYANVSSEFVEGVFSRFLSFSIGSSVQLTDSKPKTGLFTKVSTGIRMYNAKGSAASLSFAYELQRIKTTNSWNWNGSRRDYNALSINLGILF